jgi:PAS domain S-box-containing protein
MLKEIREPAIPNPAAGSAESVAEAQRQEALLKTGALQSAIFNSANFWIIATDAKGVIQIFNVSAERTLGYTAAEVVNKMTPADVSDPLELIARAEALTVELGTPIAPGFEALAFKAARGIEDIYELTYVCKDGSHFPSVLSVTALRDDQDAIIGYLLIGTDNTARKRAEEQARIAEITYSGIIDSITETIYIQDENGIFLNVSLAAEEMYGYPREYFVGRTPEFIAAPGKNNLAEIGKYVREAFNGQRKRFEFWGLRKDGTVFPKDVSLVPGTYFGKKVVIAVARDISERKQAEAALKHANRALATLSEVDRTLVHATSEEEILQKICQAIVQQRGYRLAWVGYVQHDEGKSIKIMAHAGHDEGYLATMQLTWADTERGQGPAGRSIRSGITQLCQDIAHDPQYLLWRDEAQKYGLASSIALALMNGDNVVFGTLAVYSDEVNAFVADEIRLLEEMASDLAFGVKALNTSRERDLALEKNQQQLTQLQDNLEDTVRAIATIVEMRDPYTSGHQVKVADLAAAIAKQMGLPDEQVHAIHLAGVVHDLGKIQIPAEILSKPGKISDAEFALIKAHPQAGYDILKGINFPWPIAQIVLQHHERMDGSGYPQGLKGDQILLEARILGVADVVEAMSSHRPYRAGLGIEVALAEIIRQRGSHFDQQVVDACLAVFREQHYAFKIDVT